MKKLATSYSNSLNDTFIKELDVSLDVTYNPYNFELGSLFQMAARKNPKRNFLFVSKVLGKHIPVPPQIPLINGLLLADLFLKEYGYFSPFNVNLLKNSIENYAFIPYTNKEIEKKINLKEKTLFIGFAETATGLGHAMFHPFVDNAEYIHTTREKITSVKSAFSFEEEHSHATSHSCFAKENNYFEKFDRIVLIDDEITTGNTAINLIKALNARFPNKEYVVASILDWRNEQEKRYYQRIEHELNIKIKTLSLVSGEITYTAKQFKFDEATFLPLNNHSMEIKTIELPLDYEHKFYETTYINEKVDNKLYSTLNGRFGLKGIHNQNNKSIIQNFAKIIDKNRKHEHTLVVGSGEFMFIPSWIATYLKGQIEYYSTTRSPIYAINRVDYPIQNVVTFPNPEEHSVVNYLYNIKPSQYKEMVFILERDIDEVSKNDLAKKLLPLGVQSLIFAVFT